MMGGLSIFLEPENPALHGLAAWQNKCGLWFRKKKKYRISSFPNFAIWIIAQIIHLKTKSNQATVLKIE